MKRIAAVLGAVAIWSVAPRPAPAQVGIDSAASILVYPKVIADGVRDTTIHLSNASNGTVSAHCYYVDAAPANPSLPPDPILNPPLLQVYDFELNLTSNQPTVWLASTGRPLDGGDDPCNFIAGEYECYGAGMDPGDVPALPETFIGELVCVETDASGGPLAGNHLTGAATIKDVASGDVSRYRAIGAIGNENVNADEVLCLGGSVSTGCPTGPEYDACPQSWLIDVRAEGSAIEGVPGSDLSTEITVVSCDRDLEDTTPNTVVLQYSVRNEFEQSFSASSTTASWSSQALSSIGPIWDATVLGTATARTEVRPSAASGGFLLLAEETGTADSIRASAGLNAHVEGIRPDGDAIMLPPVL